MYFILLTLLLTKFQFYIYNLRNGIHVKKEDDPNFEVPKKVEKYNLDS